MEGTNGKKQRASLVRVVVDGGNQQLSPNIRTGKTFKQNYHESLRDSTSTQ